MLMLLLLLICHVSVREALLPCYQIYHITPFIVIKDGVSWH